MATYQGTLFFTDAEGTYGFTEPYYLDALTPEAARTALDALAVARAEPGVPDGATQADFNATECAKRIAAGIEKLMGGE